MSAMGWTISNYLVSGVAPEPMGDQNATAAPSGTFDAADGPLNIAANRQQQFETLCALVDRPGAGHRPPVRRPRGPQAPPRRAQRGAQRRAARRTAGEWEQILGARRSAGRPDRHRAAGARAEQLASSRVLHRPAVPRRRRPYAAGRRQRGAASTANRCVPPLRRRSSASRTTSGTPSGPMERPRGRRHRLMSEPTSIRPEPSPTGGRPPSPAWSPASSNCADIPSRTSSGTSASPR